MQDRSRAYSSLYRQCHDVSARGDWYEALQLYKTLYARCVAHKDTEEAVKVLMEGALIMGQNAHPNGCTELGQLYIKLLIDNAHKPTKDNLGFAVLLMF